MNLWRAAGTSPGFSRISTDFVFDSFDPWGSVVDFLFVAQGFHGIQL
jgi:hypothetical protein